MKIAVYKDNLSTGRGADRAVKNFAAGLAGRGHAVALMEKDEFRIRVLDSPGVDTADANVFDVIVPTGSNEIADMAAAGYFGRPDRAKVVLQLHLAPRGFFKWKHPFRNRRIRAAFDMPDAVQLLCGCYVDEFKRIAPHPEVAVIGNYTEMRPPAEYDVAVSSRSRMILYPAATVNKIKNQKLLIEAFAVLAREFPGWRLRLLGKDTTPYARDCRRLIDAKGLSGRVELAGFTDDLAGEYSHAAFIAFPSTLEGFPLAILEAAGFSLATVAQSTLPGVSDIVRDGETGLVTDGNAAAYAEGLRRMMSDVDVRRHLGEKAKNFCAANYSRESILDKWESLLGSVRKRNA